VIHAVPGERNFHGLGEGVLSKMALPGLLDKSKDVVRGAESMKDGPVHEVLDGVIRPVVASPALHAEEPAALVEVFLEEFLARGGVDLEKGALQKSPSRRRHGGVNLQNGALCARRLFRKNEER